jgi:hypothetical protein
MNVRRRIAKALDGTSCTPATIKLIGCTVEELMRHLESRFKSGMTWENYNYRGWHIDHVKPLALFNFLDPAQIEEAFHYTNLQPLWAHENFSKGGRN